MGVKFEEGGLRMTVVALLAALERRSWPPPPRIRVKQVRFGKLAFLQQNGAFFEPQERDFRLFRATFSVQKFGPFFVAGHEPHPSQTDMGHTGQTGQFLA